jgi:hypothetical protein
MMIAAAEENVAQFVIDFGKSSSPTSWNADDETNAIISQTCS